MQIDRSTEFGARVARRLAGDHVIWLTTVGRSGTPYPRPVWFLWDGESILIYSQPETAKLRHLARHPRVSLNFDGDPDGNDIVVLTGAARIDPSAPPADQVPAFIEKYRAPIESLNMTPASFAAEYSVAVRVSPEKLWGF